MTRTITIAVVALAAASPVPGADSPPPTVEGLKALTARQGEVQRAEAALAWARAKLAKAEGKPDLAAAEGRKVLAYREAVWKMYAAPALSCGSREELRVATRDLLDARILLAEVEGRPDVLRAELPRLVTWHEQQVQLYKALLRVGGVSEREAQRGTAESEAELRAARARLAQLQTEDKGSQP